MPLLAACLLLVASLAYAAEEPNMQNYAQANPITTDGSSAIYRIELPAEVYETVARYDLGDVRVFNQDGERVPFAIQRQEQKKVLKTAWFDLPVFPLRGNVEKLTSHWTSAWVKMARSLNYITRVMVQSLIRTRTNTCSISAAFHNRSMRWK
jgi:predicted SnoaL-like aldol condensation-catalyzing enzyme